MAISAIRIVCQPKFASSHILDVCYLREVNTFNALAMPAKSIFQKSVLRFI